MVYQWLHSYAEQFSALNVFKYITFRAFLAFFTSFFVCYFLGPIFINRLQKKQVQQSIRDDGPQSHKKKAGTPTMGGGLILMGLLVAALFWVNLFSPMVLGILLITLGFGYVGYFDDFQKVSKKNTKGVPGKVRLALEFLIAGAVLSFLISRGALSTQLHLPFFKSFVLDMGYFYVIFGSLVIVGCANAVNLTDGLDGLAIMPVLINAATLGVFAYLAGHSEISHYLNIPFVMGAGELVPLAAAMVAAGLGFLWFNTYPAQVFMGDIGSLSIGGFIGALAVLTKNEIVLVFLGGVFVVEALSVITQVASFKLTGRRIFRMAPLHHHFELGGLTETKIIVRFWIISILLAVLSLSTLKLR